MSKNALKAAVVILAAVCVIMSYASLLLLGERDGLRATVIHLNAETANRAATSELQSRVIAAYTAELMRLGYSEDRLDAIQRSK